jgi:lipopolysaccharide/colanic/teichoic acid biosynthesis glycosyltransferase
VKEMVVLDLCYIENQSIFFDIEILFATIPVVLFGRGAY